jgi:hypothetical protein
MAEPEFLYQLQFKPARRRMFTLRENMLFCEQWTRSFELESVLWQLRLHIARRRMFAFREKRAVFRKMGVQV